MTCISERMGQSFLVWIYKVVVDSQNFLRGFFLKSFFLFPLLDGLVFHCFNQGGALLGSNLREDSHH